MTPGEATKFEYFDSSAGAFTPYVHAAAASAAAHRGGRQLAAAGVRA